MPPPTIDYKLPLPHSCALMFQAKELLEQNQLSLFVDQKLRSNHDSAKLEEMVQIALLYTMYRPGNHPKMSKIVKMLEGGHDVTKKWKAMKNIGEPNPDWLSEFVCFGLNYYEDRCNSIELQAIELSGACVCMCMRVCVLCVCVVGLCT